MAEISMKDLLKEFQANNKELKRINEILELGALSGASMGGVGNKESELKKRQREIKKIIKERSEKYHAQQREKAEQAKVFSATMIAQQARKEAAKVAEQKALASEKPVLKVTKTRVAYSPRVPEPTE